MADETEAPERRMGDGANEDAVDRGYVFKAHVLGSDFVQTSRAIDGSEQDRITSIFSKQNVLSPAYDPESLLRIVENSSSLGPNIESYVTNIDGLGWRLAPVVDFDSDDAWETVRELMWLEAIRAEEARALAADHDADPDTQPDAMPDLEQLMPSDDEVDARIEKLRTRSRVERMRAQQFFDFVNPSGSFTSLRRMTRTDLESTGNAYWEVLRNKRGEIARFVHVPPSYVRLTRKDPEPTTVHDRVPAGLGWDTVTQRRYFRRYVQAHGKQTTYFKQFGDPRVISQLTGKVYKNLATFTGDREKPEGDRPATELIHFKVHRSGEPYGQPRWIGNLLSVLGSRATDEVNFAYFDNKAIPPLVIKVQGGKMADDTVKKIETYIRDEIKGRQNFHKILLLEAQAGTAMAGDMPVPKIELEPLTKAQQNDGQFQKYDERNIDKVGSSFRTPRLLRGDVRDFNRATADASLRFADEQVFQPERNEFDGWLTRVIFPQLGVRWWKFASLGPRTRDPEMVAKIVKDSQGSLTPNESREILADALGRELPPFSDAWAKQPLMLTLAGFMPQEEGPPIAPETEALLGEAADAVTGGDDDRLRAIMAAAQALSARERARRALASEADEEHEKGERREALGAAE